MLRGGMRGIPVQHVRQGRQSLSARADGARNPRGQPFRNLPEYQRFLLHGKKSHVRGKAVHQPVVPIHGLRRPVRDGKARIQFIRFQQPSLFIAQQQGRKTGEKGQYS